MCDFPGCRITEPVERHHVTYVNPGSGLKPRIAMLCNEHHHRATAINDFFKGDHGGRNDDREKLFDRWTNKEIIAIKFSEVSTVKLRKFGRTLNLNEARYNAYVILEEYDDYRSGKRTGSYTIIGYARGKGWENCPTCGQRITP